MTIKVVSLNLWLGGILFDEVCAFIAKESPDILMLQEVYDGKDPGLERRFRTLEEFIKRFNYPAYDFVPTCIEHRKEGKIVQGSAVFSRCPITAQDAVFFNEPFSDHYVDVPGQYAHQPHALQHLVLATPAGDLNVYNLHGSWDLDGDNFSEARRQMSEAVITAVQGKTKVILAGDTNARPTNQAMINIEKQLTSVFGRELPSTFNMRRKDNPGYASAAVDMMFITPDITVTSKACPDVDISDHLPLVVTVKIQKDQRLEENTVK